MGCENPIGEINIAFGDQVSRNSNTHFVSSFLA